MIAIYLVALMVCVFVVCYFWMIGAYFRLMYKCSGFRRQLDAKQYGWCMNSEKICTDRGWGPEKGERSRGLMNRRFPTERELR